MKGIYIDPEQWPVIYVVYPDELDNAMIAAFVGNCLELCRKARHGNQRFAIVADLRRLSLKHFSASTRKSLGEGLASLDEAGGDLLACECVVTNSALLRTIVGALYWLRPKARPAKTFEDPIDALQWAKTTLGREALKAQGA